MTPEDKLRRLYIALIDTEAAISAILQSEPSGEFPERDDLMLAFQSISAFCSNIRVYKCRSEEARWDRARELKDAA